MAASIISQTHTLALDDGTVLQGVYLDGRGPASSEIVLPDGAKYTGALKFFKRNGVGVFTLPSGKYYVGNFKDGCRDGLVRFVDSSLVLLVGRQFRRCGNCASRRFHAISRRSRQYGTLPFRYTPGNSSAYTIS